MRRIYSNNIKKMVTRRICQDKESTSKIAKEYGIPVKTVEKWNTMYRKDPFVFDSDYRYDFSKKRNRYYEEMKKEDLIFELKRRDTRIHYLETVVQTLQSEEK